MFLVCSRIVDYLFASILLQCMELRWLIFEGYRWPVIVHSCYFYVGGVNIRVWVSVCMCLYVCVHVRVRERQRWRKRETETDRDRNRKSVSLVLILIYGSGYFLCFLGSSYYPWVWCFFLAFSETIHLCILFKFVCVLKICVFSATFIEHFGGFVLCIASVLFRGCKISVHVLDFKVSLENLCIILIDLPLYVI